MSCSGAVGSRTGENLRRFEEEWEEGVGAAGPDAGGGVMARRLPRETDDGEVFTVSFEVDPVVLRDLWKGMRGLVVARATWR